MNLPPLRIALQSSYHLLSLLLVLHGLAGAALWLAVPQAGLRLLGGIVLAASLVFYALRQSRNGGLEVDASGAWRVERDRVWHEAMLVEAFVTPLLTVLRMRLDGGQRVTLTLLPDSLAREDFRRLRVILKWAGRTPQDTPAQGAD
ncbi:protein YgfX [Sulfuriferula sp.]|uniref:protein YgfX n=1 Tax=Sulfuriferula sp. TaxID=2025307 RepID=UPI00272F8813|nr:protein YgfX [Sulfuriferula sp.]MDP2025481.1 hypothetical protein [Sulfuriferula sp.]